ncbi:zinc transporter ZntB [Sneathiella chinensis]|uniref:Zinc transporter ZntB n=1 Tax=Sneathiella chinensis TaxID=349750 RepID=A0ABQ5U1A2_9PROT|nr:zinc transporter ZntB [Sneathiella chinensis]GLQ05929.1 zinc transporter ZntB [Sneathiella chinensis]
MSEHILRAYCLDGQGGAEAVAPSGIRAALDGDKPVWVHLDAGHPDTEDWMNREIPFLDPHIVAALVADETRPRMAEAGGGTLLFLRGVNLNENADPEDMVSIRLWVDGKRIISARRRRLKAVTDIDNSLKAGKGPKNTGDFICDLIYRLFERMQPFVTQLDDETDFVEERLLDGADPSLREAIVNVRMQAIRFRRYMAPQRDAIGQLRMSEPGWMTEKHLRHLTESHNHVTRYVEDLDAIRERSQIIKDEIANVLADRLNKNMYVLSVIAAIFLPLGFLTGLLGINVGGIPGAENQLSFWIFCAILIALVGLQVWLFRKLKWF